MAKEQVALRYCGGCNPRFDRGGLVEKLQRETPSVELTPFNENAEYLAVLVICGCTAQCARQGDLPTDIPRFVLKDAEEYNEIFAFLHGIDKEM